MLLVERPGGAAAGYVDVSEQGGPGSFWLDLHVPPAADADEAVGTLVGAAEELAAGRAPQAIVRVPISSLDEVAAASLRTRGYHLVRHSFQMRIDLGDGVEPPSWPPGIGVRTFRPADDDERLYEAQQEAFADTHDFVRQDYEQWRSWNFLEPHDPSLWFLAEDEGEIAGICLCRPQRGDDPELGWVSVLGVRPAWRRCGLARALLRHGFGELHARGRRAVGLGVDGESPAAVGLYESAGMHVARRYDRYEKVLHA